MNIIKKLSSRKRWAACAGVIMGVAMVFGLDENTISTVSGAVVAVVSVLSYIVTEGKIDAAAVKKAIEQVQETIEELDCADGE